MRNNSKKIIKKLLICSLSIVIVSVFFIYSANTQCYFIAKAAKNAEIKTTEMKDILDWKIIYKDWTYIYTQCHCYHYTERCQRFREPIKISITKKCETEKQPIVYFEFTGSAAKYIKHFNPIKVDWEKDGAREFNIYIGVDWEGYDKLSNRWGEKPEYIEGKVTLRYLNGYIEDTKNFSASKQYAYCKFINPSFLTGNLNKKAEIDLPSFSDLKNENEKLKKEINELKVSNKKLESKKLNESKLIEDADKGDVVEEKINNVGIDAVKKIDKDNKADNNLDNNKQVDNNKDTHGTGGKENKDDTSVEINKLENKDSEDKEVHEPENHSREEDIKEDANINEIQNDSNVNNGGSKLQVKIEKNNKIKKESEGVKDFKHEDNENKENQIGG